MGSMKVASWHFLAYVASLHCCTQGDLMCDDCELWTHYFLLFLFPPYVRLCNHMYVYVYIYIYCVHVYIAQSVLSFLLFMRHMPTLSLLPPCHYCFLLMSDYVITCMYMYIYIYIYIYIVCTFILLSLYCHSCCCS